jgi:hypothetical protein
VNAERRRERPLERAPRVPRLEAARALLWLALAALSLYVARAPAEPPRLEPRHDGAAGCRLATQASGPRCACDELPADVRRVLGLPLSLARASSEDLESLPGIGPRRARAIVEERTRRPFASVEELRRVRGIGPATARSLAGELFIGTDPACESARAGPHS